MLFLGGAVSCLLLLEMHAHAHAAENGALMGDLMHQTIDPSSDARFPVLLRSHSQLSFSVTGAKSTYRTCLALSVPIVLEYVLVLVQHRVATLSTPNPCLALNVHAPKSPTVLVREPKPYSALMGAMLQ
ncbi:MAG: hypothetical protein J3Q66DRAFT_388203 [Benniella sp.]|nr:MAG: hypothetical protein J3Q66DRAFT_388203 [Benniella sp.]